jgi:hypothetical protein
MIAEGIIKCIEEEQYNFFHKIEQFYVNLRK